LATLGKLAIALVFVLIVFWAFAKLMKKLQVGQVGAHNGLKIVGALSLGQRERVVVVQAGSEQILLGVTSTQINALHVLDKPLTVGDSSEVGEFKQKLSAALQRPVKT
jgi:flagellar protein FliO/FliZ